MRFLKITKFMSFFVISYSCYSLIFQIMCFLRPAYVSLYYADLLNYFPEFKFQTVSYDF